MHELPKRDPLGACRREAIAERRLGNEKVCTCCGESHPFALEQNTNPRLCTECRRRKAGKTIMDDHHVGGEANSDVAIPVPANDHRARLSENQRDWPTATLENPDGSPLLAAAGCIRGYADTIVYLVEKLLLWIAEMLEILNVILVQKSGPKWWEKTEVEKFARPGKKPKNQS
jgi:hypothetical protein